MSDTNNEIAEPLINSVVPELVEDANVDYTSTITLPEVGKKVVKDADARGKLAEVITSTNKAIEEVIKLQGTTEQLLAQDNILANAEIDLRNGQQALAEAITTILNNQKTLAESILEGDSGGSSGMNEIPDWVNVNDISNTIPPKFILTSNGKYVIAADGNKTLQGLWPDTQDWDNVRYLGVTFIPSRDETNNMDTLTPVSIFTGLVKYTTN